ncbi:MAG: hypothetical protein M1839_002353 [Geoglossum umbratile]|nr:MAG: hypothetical protein M1839_002353 [Geoglossum umbratile]
MDTRPPHPLGKENARNQATQQTYQPPTSVSSNGASWGGSQVPFGPPQQQFPRDWQPTADQRFLPSTEAWDAFGFPPHQIAYHRDPTLLNQAQSHTEYANYGISPQALQANTINRTTPASQATNRSNRQNAQVGSQSQTSPSKPAKPAPSTALSSRAPEFIYIDSSTIPVGTIRFPHVPYALFERFSVDLNIGDERRGASGETPEVRTKKSRVKHKVAAKPAPANSNTRDPDPGDSSSESEKSESSSVPASSNEDEMDIDETSPLPPTRPTDEFAAVKYDTIKALWLPSRRRATSEEIKGALKLYWELLKEIHDTWKANSAALKKAESEQAKGEIPKLKVPVSKSLRKIDIAVSTALEQGHRDILECLADVALPQFLISWLISRVQEDDVNGSITAKILELLCRCTTLTESTLERLKFNKLQHRFSKRGNDHTKVLVKRLLDNVAAATKRIAAAPKENELAGKDSKTKADAGAPKAPEPAAGVKRPRELDTSNQPQPKRQNPVPANTVISTSSKTPGPVKRPPTEPKSLPTLATNLSKQPPSSSAKQTTNTKGKANHVQARKSSLFSSFSSNAPTTPRASTSSEGSAPTASMGEARAQNVFNFSTAIANLERRTDPELSAPPANAGPPETAEEKRIRLKKEARRKFTKLGVRFKPADDLTEIRYITHDEDEEDTQEGGHTRDARNDQEEGRMFKQHVEMDMMDEEEDGGPGSVASFRPWVQPSQIDFSVLEEANHHGDRSLRDENYLSRGGVKEPQSLEKGIQEQRETTTLMVVYADPSDAPRTPREGPDLFSGEKVELVPFGSPWDITKEREAKIRQREAQQSLVSTQDISSLLKTLQQTQVQSQTPKPMTELEKIFAQYSVAQPTPQAQTLQSTAPSLGISAFAAGLNLPRQPSSDSQLQAPLPTQPTQVQQQIQAQQIQAILQQLGQGNAAQGQAFGGLAFSQQPYQQYPAQSNSQQPQHQAHAEQGSSYQADRDEYYPRNSKDRSNRWGNGDSSGDRRGGRNDYGYGGHGDSRGGVNGDRKKASRPTAEPM